MLLLPFLAPASIPNGNVNAQQAQQLAQQLSELRGIHLPEAISPWWPIAPGWWALLILVPLLVLLCAWLFKYFKNRTAIKKQALLVLSAAYKDADGNFLHQTNDVLKRYCKHYEPEIAALSGDQWSRFLNQQGANIFTEEQLSLLAHGIYQKHAQYDKKSLFSNSKLWLEKNDASTIASFRTFQLNENGGKHV